MSVDSLGKIVCPSCGKDVEDPLRYPTAGPRWVTCECGEQLISYGKFSIEYTTFTKAEALSKNLWMREEHEQSSNSS